MNKADEKRYTKDQVDLAIMVEDLKRVKETVTDINRKLDAEYITKEQLRVIEIRLEQLQKQADFTQKIVYGVIGTIALTVFGAIIKLVVTV